MSKINIKKNKIIQQVKEAVGSFSPSAKVILYGSRARGDAKEESDWDFLILIDNAVTTIQKQLIRHDLYKIEWHTGAVISSIIESKYNWNTPIIRSTPFYKNIKKEGIPL